MEIGKLTFIGFYLNGALGSGNYNDITIEEVKNKICNRTIFDYLYAKLGHDIDLSLLTEENKKELNEDWIDLVDTVDERKKMSVDKNGLCLLVAYLLEGIRRRQDE